MLTRVVGALCQERPSGPTYARISCYGTLARSLGCVVLASLAAAAQDPERPEVVRTADPVPETMTREEAKSVLARSLAYLTATQRADGSWGSGANENLAELGYSVESYYDWKVASHALAVMALAQCEETPQRRAALERAVDWLCSTRIPKRGSNWDADYTWPGLYGFVACVLLMDDPRFSAPEWRDKVERRGLEFWRILEHNQAPEGGWAYYDDPPYTRRLTWATSFCTGLVLPALARAEELGWIDDPAIRRRATRYVRRCALPGGAYEYDLRPVARITGGEHINRVKGSLSRIQVCNWGLAASGEKSVTPDKIRAGLEAFFEHHKFLDAARMRPIPHEAYYANAGYFYFFGHYYAAQAIGLLPAEEREAWHARLRPHLAKTVRADGSTSDFLSTTYMIVASTSYLSLALDLGLPPLAEH